MRVQFAALIPVFFVATTCLAGQNPKYGFPPGSRIESQQGQDGEPGVIGHKRISKGTNLKCIQVQHHPKRTDDGAACLVRFENGDKQTLPAGQVTKAPEDGEVYLECLGDKPTRCAVGVW